MDHAVHSTASDMAGASATAVQAAPTALSDDHTAADLGCAGNAHIRTPNLDKLAALGVRFANCFVA